MTTYYVHHWLIEEPDTAATVVLAFGGWWEVTGGVTPETNIPVFMNHYRRLRASA